MLTSGQHATPRLLFLRDSLDQEVLVSFKFIKSLAVVNKLFNGVHTLLEEGHPAEGVLQEHKGRVIQYKHKLHHF